MGETVDFKYVCRSPYGERGLKYDRRVRPCAALPSLSLRRAWIEMSMIGAANTIGRVALLTESVD